MNKVLLYKNKNWLVQVSELDRLQSNNSNIKTFINFKNFHSINYKHTVVSKCIRWLKKTKLFRFKPNNK